MSIPCAEEEIQVPGSRCKHDLGMKIDVMTFDWILFVYEYIQSICQPCLLLLLLLLLLLPWSREANHLLKTLAV